ncbi:7213_t:CDS:2, partial [Funneliformis caledonium]
EIELEQLDYTRRALKDTNNEIRHIRNITTNKMIKILDQDHTKKPDYQEEVNSSKEELANDSGNVLREASESMVGKIERILLTSEFVLNTYSEHNLPRTRKVSYKNSSSQKSTKFTKTWQMQSTIFLHYTSEASCNILKSGDLRENQYNAQFVSPILKNTLKVICNIDWRILKVPVESSKDRCNANLNPIIDKVLEAKYADELARL